MRILACDGAAMPDPREPDTLRQLHILLKLLKESPADLRTHDIIKRLLCIRIRILALEANQRLASETPDPTAQ